MTTTDIIPTSVMACCALHNLRQSDPELIEDFEGEKSIVIMMMTLMKNQIQLYDIVLVHQ